MGIPAREIAECSDSRILDIPWQQVSKPHDFLGHRAIALSGNLFHPSVVGMCAQTLDSDDTYS